MIKVYESFDLSRVGHMQSLLESHGIRTFMRNQFGSSVMGEVPFIEVVPQLFVLRDQDVARALDLLRVDVVAEPDAELSTCLACGAEVSVNFSHCWSCGAPLAAP